MSHDEEPSEEDPPEHGSGSETDVDPDVETDPDDENTPDIETDSPADSTDPSQGTPAEETEPDVNDAGESGPKTVETDTAEGAESVADDDPAAAAAEEQESDKQFDSEMAAVERIDDLETELAERESEIEDLKSRLKRVQADFQNYKKRMKRRQEEVQERATENLVERLLDVRDNLKRALEAESDDIDDIREGVKMTLAELDRVLDAEGVSGIEPNPGDEVDPNRHEVMLQIDGNRPEGMIEEVYTPGYEMGSKILRPAQVTVSNGSGAADDDDSDEIPEESGTDEDTTNGTVTNESTE